MMMTCLAGRDVPSVTGPTNQNFGLKTLPPTARVAKRDFRDQRPKLSS